MLGTAPYPLSQLETVEPEVVVEVAEVVAVEARALAWLQLMHVAVCKVLFFMMVYRVEYYLILEHRIHLYLDSFA